MFYLPVPASNRYPSLPTHCVHVFSLTQVFSTQPDFNGENKGDFSYSTCTVNHSKPVFIFRPIQWEICFTLHKNQSETQKFYAGHHAKIISKMESVLLTSFLVFTLQYFYTFPSERLSTVHKKRLCYSVWPMYQLAWGQTSNWCFSVKTLSEFVPSCITASASLM